MGDRTRAVIREITPPVLLRATRPLRARFAPEQPPEYYDDLFQTSPGYSLPYTQSHYYFLWSVIADRLVTANARQILDVGCGPGQFAKLLYDKGFRHYCGIDFSAAAIQLATTRCPDFEFVRADLRDPGLLEGRIYDWALVLETLEHVEDDLGLLSRLRPGCRVILTVPNFGDPSHVRFFKDAAEVQERYGHLFTPLRVDTFIENESCQFFLLEGERLA